MAKSVKARKKAPIMVNPEPWVGYSKLTLDERCDSLYNTLTTKNLAPEEASTLIEQVAEYEEESWGASNTTSEQDLMLDYLDDWLDYFEQIGNTSPLITYKNSPQRPTDWHKYSAGNTHETPPLPPNPFDSINERLNRIEAQLGVLQGYLRRQANERSWIQNWAEHGKQFNDFYKAFEEAGTEAAEVAKAVSDLTQMAAQLAPKSGV